MKTTALMQQLDRNNTHGQLNFSSNSEGKGSQVIMVEDSFSLPIFCSIQRDCNLVGLGGKYSKPPIFSLISTPNQTREIEFSPHFCLPLVFTSTKQIVSPTPSHFKYSPLPHPFHHQLLIPLIISNLGQTTKMFFFFLKIATHI